MAIKSPTPPPPSNHDSEQESPKSTWDSETEFLKLARAVLSLVKGRARTEGIPAFHSQKLVFLEEGWGYDSGVVHRYSQLIWNHREEVCSLPEVVAYATGTIEHGPLKVSPMIDVNGAPILVPTLAQQHSGIILSGLLDPLCHAMDDNLTIEPSEAQLIEAHRRQRRELDAKGVRKTLVVPLINFSSDTNEVQYGDVTIARLMPEQKTSLWGPYVDEFISTQTMSNVGFALFGERTYLPDEPLPEGRLPLLVNAERIVTALRLVKSGSVGFLVGFEQSGWRRGREMRMAWPLQDFRVQKDQKAYRLIREDLDQVARLFKALQVDRPDLSIGLRRFNQSYERYRPEDRLIDLAIVLESTLLSDVKDELKYRLALRGATLLASRFDPAAVQKFLLAVYDIRSQVVHNGSNLGDKGVRKIIQNKILPFGVQDVVTHLEDLVRAILVSYVFDSRSINNVNADIDDSLVAKIRPPAT